jgi:DNA recombination protein RmuC
MAWVVGLSMAFVLLAALGLLVFFRLEGQKLQAQLKQATADAMLGASQNFLNLAETRMQNEAQKQQHQLDSTKKDVESLVKPLAQALDKYQQNLIDSEKLRAQDNGSLDRMLKMVLESSTQLKTETTNLVHALKRPTVRGRWGELQLRRVVELAGMSEHCDFTEQNTVDSEEGRLRPDMVVRMPSQRVVVVDSKATLAGYLDAEAATDETIRKGALSRHAAAVRLRIQELSRKNYWDQFENAPEFVVLFIPGEAFFSAALEEQPDLVEYGFNQKVVLATPSTLMALLKAVAYGWRQEQLSQNAKEVSELASRIYQGLSVWTSHLANVGVSIDRAAKSYNMAVGSLERTVMPPLRKLKDSGISVKAELSKVEQVENSIRELVLEKDI